MVTDAVALWTKALPELAMKLGLFVSLVPPCLWYQGFLHQKPGWKTRHSLNSHIGKICKLLQVTVILHPHLLAEEKWFHDLQADAITLSEPGYDLMLQDICLAIATKLQFSPIPWQRKVASLYWHQAPYPPVPAQGGSATKCKGRKKAEGNTTLKDTNISLAEFGSFSGKCCVNINVPNFAVKACIACHSAKSHV